VALALALALCLLASASRNPSLATAVHGILLLITEALASANRMQAVATRIIFREEEYDPHFEEAVAVDDAVADAATKGSAAREFTLVSRWLLLLLLLLLLLWRLRLRLMLACCLCFLEGDPILVCLVILKKFFACIRVSECWISFRDISEDGIF